MIINLIQSKNREEKEEISEYVYGEYFCLVHVYPECLHGLVSKMDIYLLMLMQ